MTLHPSSTIDQCRFITLPHDIMQHGTLCVAESADVIPFDIKRIYYIYDTPAGAERGGHSHHNEQCILVATSGCFDVTVCDGSASRTFTLNRPYQALYIPAGIWRTLENFSSGSIVLALSSIIYDESDYVRDFDTFLKLKKQNSDV